MRLRPVLFLILFAVAGYLGYRWFSSGPPEVWNYIPDSASVVISSDKLQNRYNAADTLAGETFSSAYRDLPLVSLAAGNLSLMSWFSRDEAQIYTFLKSKTITYAFHPLAGSRLGIVMYLPVKSELEEKWLNNPKDSSLRVSSHNFQGHIITDISNERSEALFSYILKSNYLIISQYGELIEDVIRNARSGGRQGENPMTEIALPEGKHDLSIYANGEAWRGFVFPEGIHPNVSAFLDILPARHGIHMEPPTSPGRLVMESQDIDARENPYYPLLSNQGGTPFTSTGYISQQTTHLIRLAVEKGDMFNQALLKWMKGRQSLPALTRFDQLAGKSKDTFLRAIGPEIILCVNESSGGISDSKVMLVRYENFENVKPVIRQMADKTGDGSAATTSFQGYEVYPVLIPDLMEALFGPVFKGFRESYLTYIAPYLVVGNSPQAIQNYLIDYENQLTWAHSPDLDSALFKKNTDAQLSLITNMSKARAGAGLNRTTLKSSLDQIATTQMSYSQKGRYADLSLALNYAVSSRTKNKTELKADFEWKDEFPPAFSVTSDPGAGTSEIILTNKAHQLIGIDNGASGKPRILAQLDGPMVGRAFRADFLNIGRPQRIVSTAGYLYVLDEDENGIFTLLSKPSASPTNALYRISHSLESGASFVLKGSDQNLYTWKTAGAVPSKLNLRTTFDDLLSPVVSFAKGNSNLYIATQRNGKIFVLDENGKSLPGFPVDMLSGISGPFAPVQNPSNGEIEIAGVNRQGELSQIDLNGQLKTRKQLLLPEAGSTFRTLYDENTLDWLILRQTSGKAALLSKDGKEIFEIVGLRPGFAIRYHYFGSDNRFISVVSAGFISIFDFNGNRIGDTPIPCLGALGINYEAARKELSIFSQAENKVQVWSVKL